MIKLKVAKMMADIVYRMAEKSVDEASAWYEYQPEVPEDATVGIITNDFHMFRALQIAEKQGLSNVCGIAADSTRFYLPNNMFREYLAEIKFLLKCKLQ